MEQLWAPAELKLYSHVARNWKRLEQQFHLYVRASGATEKPRDQKVAIFTNIVGTKELDI